MKKTDIGKIIKENRLKLGITQEELAKKLKVSNKAVSKWESGKSSPKVNILKELSSILDVDFSNFIEENEKNNINEYEYSITYKTDTNFYKIRNTLKSILMVLMISILSIYVSIIYMQEKGANINNEYLTLNGYKALKKENNEIINKCDYILNNYEKVKFSKNENKVIKKNGENYRGKYEIIREYYDLFSYETYSYINDDENFEEEEAEKLSLYNYIYWNVKRLKDFTIYKQELLDELWNNKKESNYNSRFILDFINKYINYKDKNLLKGNTSCLYGIDGYSDGEYCSNIDINGIYDILWYYGNKEEMKKELTNQKRNRKASGSIISDNYQYNAFSYKVMKLNALGRFSDNSIADLQNALLVIDDANIKLLDDIIKVGGINE